MKKVGEYDNLDGILSLSVHVGATVPREIIDFNII